MSVLSPVVSVVVPVYNGQESVKRCIASLMAQTYENLEIILVNDGSTDDTGKICRNLADRDCRIKFYSQDNKGVSAARNLGLNYTTGDYVCFVDADDYVEKEFVEKHLSNFVLDENIDLSVCGFVDETLDQQVIHKSEISRSYVYDVKEFNKNDFVPYVCWQIMVKRAVLDHQRPIRFDEHISIREDFLFLYTVLVNCRRVALSPDVLYHSIYSEDSLSHTALSAKGIDKYATSLDAFRKTLEVTRCNDAVNQMVALLILKETAKMESYFTRSSVFRKKYRHEIDLVKKEAISEIRKHRYSLKESVIIAMIVFSPRIYVRLAK